MSLRPPHDVPANLREFQRWCQLQTAQGYRSALVVDTTHNVADEDVVLVDDDTAGGAVTINLPPALNNEERVVRVKKLGSTGNVTIDADGSETIDGSTTLVSSTQYTSYTLFCDGTEWHIV